MRHAEERHNEIQSRNAVEVSVNRHPMFEHDYRRDRCAACLTPATGL